jgi:acyl-CoA reductase-like NAD-dependent aldehyde dehydrogenase
MPFLPLVRVRDVNEAIDWSVKAEGGNFHTATMHSRNVANLSRMASLVNTTIFVKNGPCLAGLGYGGEGHTTLTIAGPTGEGITSPRSFTRQRRCVLVDYFRII